MSYNMNYKECYRIDGSSRRCHYCDIAEYCDPGITFDDRCAHGEVVEAFHTFINEIPAVKTVKRHEVTIIF